MDPVILAKHKVIFFKELDENKAAKAEAEEILAASEGELAITTKALAEAQAALDLVHADCMQIASDHEITVQGRKEELAALAKAKKIIQQMTAGAVGQSYSFIQTSSLTRTASAGMEVVNLVKKLAREQHSTAGVAGLRRQASSKGVGAGPRRCA